MTPLAGLARPSSRGTAPDRTEIRMFGRLFVRRSDGEVVGADEWSTGKTADLLRLLALHGNRPVSVQSLISKLWPDVEEHKAKASLRTAASRVRQVLGEPCVERSLGGLVLRNTWSDVVTFQSIVHEMTVALRGGDHARVVERAHEAEALYVADFEAYDDRSFWATETRESLRLSRQSMLADAGESALKLMWMRDAIDFSTSAIAEDVCFERPHRTLMRAHAALGEVELALRAFEHCRVALSQELGADPSPQTRALHIQILSGDTEQPMIKPFAGRVDEVRAAAGTLRRALAGDGCDVVCVTGPPGSGRSALLETAVAQIEDAHLRVLLDDGLASIVPGLADVAGDHRSDIVAWGPCDGDPRWEVIRLLTAFAEIDTTAPRVIAVITSSEAGDLLAEALEDGPISLHRVTSGPLSDADLKALAATALSGTPTPHLLQELTVQSERMAGRAVWILRDWMTAGWILSTMDGLELYQGAPAFAGEAPVGTYFRLTLERLTHDELEFCQLLALMDRPVSAEMVHRMIGDEPDIEDIQTRLDGLADLGLLRIGRPGYEFRNRAMRDAFELNLRPSVKARAQRRIGRAAV
ncbi:MAG: BTAD domain-containing putative transcriptional regulator [Aeromicrobium sp.]